VCFLALWTVSAAAADPQYLVSIAATESGTIYLADVNLPGVWKLENEKLTLLFEGSKTFRTPLNRIRCVAIDSDGKLLAGDSATRDIYRFDDSGKPVGLTQKSGPAAATPEKAAPPPATGKDAEKPAAEKNEDKKSDTAFAEAEQDTKKAEDAEKKSTEKTAPAARKPFVHGEIGIPMDIAVDKAGDIFVSDLELHRIVKVAKAGGPAKEFAKVQAPRGLCMDADQNLWVISGRKLVKVSPAGEQTTVVEDGTFNYPHTVAVAADKTAYVCDGYEKCIWKVPTGAKPEKLVSGEPFINPVGMRLAGEKLYVVDPRAKAVFQITLDGKLTSVPMNPQP
jgi:sugar lactone lactonase YvrE